MIDDFLDLFYTDQILCHNSESSDQKSVRSQRPGIWGGRVGGTHCSAPQRYHSTVRRAESERGHAYERHSLYSIDPGGAARSRDQEIPFSRELRNICSVPIDSIQKRHK